MLKKHKKEETQSAPKKRTIQYDFSCTIDGGFHTLPKASVSSGFNERMHFTFHNDSAEENNLGKLPGTGARDEEIHENNNGIK